MLYRVAHGNLETPSMFSEKAGLLLIGSVQSYFSVPLRLVPVIDEGEERPPLRMLEGGRK